MLLRRFWRLLVRSSRAGGPHGVQRYLRSWRLGGLAVDLSREIPCEP